MKESLRTCTHAHMHTHTSKKERRNMHIKSGHHCIYLTSYSDMATLYHTSALKELYISDANILQVANQMLAIYGN
jgi:hypothetical protein